MLGSLYKSVFGELPKNVQERINGLVDSTEGKSDNDVSEMIKKYQSMNDKDRNINPGMIKIEISIHE